MPLKRDKALLVVNPMAGNQGGRRNFYSIVHGLSEKYTLVTHITETFDDARKVASEAGNFNTVICCGGDGTVSQIIDGYPLNIRIPNIGYIPCGTANDFATTMKYSRSISKAVKDVINGYPTPHDLGQFNGKRFIYIAAFGAFTKVSYNTPQDIKNVLGPLAYLLNGALELGSIKGEKVKLECDGRAFEWDDVCFLAALNTRSIGGFLKFAEDQANLSDGKHELLIIRKPKTVQRLSELVSSLSISNFNDPGMVLLRGSEFKITTDEKVSWTLDGEEAGEADTVRIKNLPHAVNFIVPTDPKLLKSANK